MGCERLISVVEKFDLTDAETLRLYQVGLATLSAHIGQRQRAAHRKLSKAGPNGPVSIETVGLLLECMLVVQEKERDEGVKYHVKGKPPPTAASGTVN
jgi:hypothetical protein